MATRCRRGIPSCLQTQTTLPISCITHCFCTARTTSNFNFSSFQKHSNFFTNISTTYHTYLKKTKLYQQQQQQLFILVKYNTCIVECTLCMINTALQNYQYPNPWHHILGRLVGILFYQNFTVIRHLNFKGYLTRLPP
jgi:hypothetical protein